MHWSVADYKSVKSSADFRIDAEHLANSAMKIRNAIMNGQYADFFQKIIAIESGKNLVQFDNDGIPFLRTQNIKDVLVDPSSTSYTKQKMNFCDEGDLLL
jgi:hypothetical protein